MHRNESTYKYINVPIMIELALDLNIIVEYTFKSSSLKKAKSKLRFRFEVFFSSDVHNVKKLPCYLYIVYT
jgi:hypothetical protein